jgi:hypothetical protein
VGGLVGVGKIAAEVADGRFALVENGGVAPLLAQAGEFDVGQALDGFKEVDQARLGHGVQGEVGPELIDFGVGGRLDIVAVFAFKEVADDEGIALVIGQDFGGEIGGGRAHVEKLIRWRLGPRWGTGSPSAVRVLVVGVVIAEGGLAVIAQVEQQIGTGRQAAPGAFVQMNGAVQVAVAVPVVGAEQKGAVGTAETGHELKIVGMLPRLRR